jgi:NADH:ubiquinone oxidoreductase subunit 4 (subunit M)
MGSVLLLLFSDTILSEMLLLFPLLIKVPLFPFLYWLPDVHAEANTSISMFLAALLLKIGIFGIMYYILLSFFMVFLLMYYTFFCMG